MQDGEIAYRRAAGLADRERAAPMREDAVFRLASLTKPLVTAAALRMVELGKIALADPVTRYLPVFAPRCRTARRYDHAAPPDDPYRGPRLSLHAAGGRRLRARRCVGRRRRAGPFDRENLKRIARAGLFYPPGETMGHSVAIDVLGAVLQVVQGQDLEAVMKTYVSGPLGCAVAEL